MGLIILYVLIALLTVLVLIGGRLQARTKTAIERLAVKVAELSERSADTTHSKSVDAGSTEIINAIEWLSTKIDQLTEHPAAPEEIGQITIDAGIRTAIERLTEQLAAHSAETSENAGHHYALDEIKAAIDALTMEVQQLTARIRKIRKPTAELERWRRGIQQELPDVLKALASTPPSGAR